MDRRHLDGPLPGREPDRVPGIRPDRPVAPIRPLVSRGAPQQPGALLRHRGHDVASALRRFEQTGEPYCGSTDPHSAGNGSIMRLAPVPLFFAGDPREAVARAADSSRTTHGARGGRRRLPLPRGPDRRRPPRGLEGRAALRSLQTRPRALGRAAARPADRRDRRRLVPPPRAARDPRDRLRRPFARGRAVGLRSQLHVPRRGAAGRQPRRRRRHHRRRLRPARRGLSTARSGIPARVAPSGSRWPTSSPRWPTGCWGSPIRRPD